MVKAEERVLLHRRNVLGRKVRGRGQHLGNAPSAGRALGVHNKQAGDHHQRVEDDGEVTQKCDDGAGLCKSCVYAVCAQHDDHREPCIEQKVHSRVRYVHQKAGALVAVHRTGVGFVKAGALIVSLGQRVDDADASHALLRAPYQGVQCKLCTGIKPYAPCGNEPHHKPQQRQCCNEHQCEHRLQRKRQRDTAHQQDGRTHTQALHPVHHLVYVVGIARQAGDEGGRGECILLCAGQLHHPCKQVVPQPPRHIPGSGASQSVGDYVAAQRRRCAEHHKPAPEKDAAQRSGGNSLIQNNREHPRQKKLGNGAEKLDEQPHAHNAQTGAQIMQNCFH